MNKLQISHQELSRLTQEALSLATSYWTSVEERPAYPATSGRETTELFSRPWAEDGLGRDVLQDFKTIANHSRPSGGKFFGYVVGSGEPVGALGDLLASVLNQNVTSWRSAPAAVSIEQAVVGWLAEAVGCAGFQGSLCGGGSAANMMGLAMAREAKAPANETGAQPSRVVYASEQVHMSIPKAIAILGMGRKIFAWSLSTTISGCGWTLSRQPLRLTAKRGLPPLQSWQQLALSTPVRSIHSAKLPKSRGERTSGCMSMAPLEDLRPWRCPRNSRGCLWRIRCRSMRTSGFISPSIAAA